MRKGGLEAHQRTSSKSGCRKSRPRPHIKEDGLLIITFDEGEDESSSCCGETAGRARRFRAAAEPAAAAARSAQSCSRPTSNPVPNHPTRLQPLQHARERRGIFGLSRLGCAANERHSAPTYSRKTPHIRSARPNPRRLVTSRRRRKTSPRKPPRRRSQNPPPPAPVCVASVLPRNPTGKLKPSKVFTGVAVEHSGNVASLSLTAVHAGRLKVIAYPKKGRARTLASSASSPSAPLTASSCPPVTAG